MNEKILVPVLGESITEATVSKWLKNEGDTVNVDCLLYTSPSPRDRQKSRMPSSA